MAEQASPVSLAEKVYALSTIYKFGKNVPIIGTYAKSQQRNLRLLDNIALLLVTEPKPDAAAVSFERRTGEVIFYYAKNRPSTTAEQNHIQELVAAVRAPTSADERMQNMLEKVVVVCRATILSRIEKLKTIILNTPVGLRCLRNVGHRGVQRYFVKNFGEWYDGYSSPGEFMDRYLSYIASLNASDCPTDELLQIIRVAYFSASYEPTDMVFIDMEMAKRVKLVGEYYGAVQRIVRSWDYIRPDIAEETKITFVEIPTPKVQLSPTPTDILVILNRYAAECDHQEIKSQSLTKAYPTINLGSALQPVTQSAHVECTLAVYLTSLHRNWDSVEIGCSKASCWLCEKFLHQQPKWKFRMSNINGKLKSGWTFPPGASEMAKQYVNQCIGRELQGVLFKAHKQDWYFEEANKRERYLSSSEEKKEIPPWAPKPTWLTR